MFTTKEIEKTAELLKKLPMFKALLKENKKLNEKVRLLEYAIEYLESKNDRLQKRLDDKEKKRKIIDLTDDSDSDNDKDSDSDEDIVKPKISIKIEPKLKKEELSSIPNDIIVSKNETMSELLTKYPEYDNNKKRKNEKVEVVIEELEKNNVDYENEALYINPSDATALAKKQTKSFKEEEYDDKLLAEIDDELSVGQELSEHQDESDKSLKEEVEEEEEEEVEKSDKSLEEEAEEEEEEVEEEEVEKSDKSLEEEVEEEEEEVEVEEEEEEEEEEEVEEEVEKSDKSLEVEAEEEEEEEEEEVEGEDEEVYEIQINGKTYYVTNEIDSVIYEADEDGEISNEVGVYKNGKPVFN